MSEAERGTPVSWLVVERGWTVVGRDGGELGRIEEVAGDTGKDIFNGLVISPGLLKRSRYIPAERVTEITEGVVRVDLDSADELDEHTDPPPSAEVLPP